MNNHSVNIALLPADDDSSRAGQAALESVHQTLRREVTRLTFRSES